MNIIKIALISALLTHQIGQSETLVPPISAVPSTYFGMHNLRFHDVKMRPTIPIGTWRLWDTGTTWAQLEQRKGAWDFKRLDLAVSIAKAQKLEIILTLGRPPSWASSRPDERSFYGLGEAAAPKSLEDFEHYVETVAKRYSEDIHIFEVWNEPASSKMFSGSISQMVDLTNAAKRAITRINKNNKLICPSPAKFESLGWFKNFVEQGGANNCDVIGYHFYTDHPLPEKRIDLFKEVKRLLSSKNFNEKPIWDTESGINTVENKNSLQIARSGYLARWMILTWALGVERFYWYSWDHDQRGFINPTTGSIHRDLVKAYETVQKWMLGSTFSKCSSKDELWQCDLRLNNNKLASIFWTQGHSTASVDITNSATLEDIGGFSGKPTQTEIFITSDPIFIVWK
nr:cellulase family glycosylhydrolase [uncultured Rhodoferax sp.]